MKRRVTLVIAAMAAVAVLTVLAAVAGAAVAPVGQAIAPGLDGDAQQNELTAWGPYPGVYAARDWRRIDPSVYPVVGGHETFTWKEIEYAEGEYYWTRLDNFIADQAALGKKAAIGITTYNGRIAGGLVVPTWFENNYGSALISCSGVTIPRYWDSTYQTKYGAFVQALANHLGNNPNIAFVQIGVGLYGETQPSDDDKPGQGTYDTTCVKNAMDADFGYSNDTQRAAKWIATVKQIIDSWGGAFRGHQKLFLVYTPTFINVCEKQELTYYAANTYGIGLFAGGFYADTMTVFSNPPGGSGCQKWDPIVYWNGLGGSIPVGMESYGYMLPTFDQFYWGMLGALNKHPDYLNLESDLFFTGNVGNPIWQNLEVMRFANLYLGRTTATAPNAWVALRDTSPATNGHGCNRNYFWPQYGDFDYWLYRDDTIAGGRTITVSAVPTYTIMDPACGTVGTVVNNPQYDGKLAGKGAEGWVTRRTDAASGNDYMYFRVDDAFVAAQGFTSTAVVTVTYFDTGSDSWQIQWRTAAGANQALSVTKTNSNTWKKATLTLNNISFAGKYDNGNDFRIYNGGSGDEYIHMVMIGKPVSGAPTATPTRTATPTATPGPVTVTFQQGVSPSAGYNGVIDAFISRYDEGDQDSNFGISPTLSLRNNDYRASLLRFDVSSIPLTADVLSATLSVHVYNSTNLNPLDVYAYRMLRSWTELGVTWNQASGGVPWAVAGANGIGADRDDLVLDSETMNAVGTWYDFDITDLARLWVSTPAQNYGVALKTSGGSQVEYELWSSNYDIAPVVRPKLTIVYSTSAGGPTPTRTPTRTATISPTPTRTLTPTPRTITFQRGVAPVAEFAGVYDTFISNFGDTTVNYGISSTLELRSNDTRAALLRFDLSGVPKTANILSAELSVHVDYKTNEFTMPVSLYKVVRPWNEMEATWQSAAVGTLWGLPGANSGSDRLTTSTASVVMASANAWYQFDVTNLAKNWVATPADNKGVILKAGTGASVAYVLRSSEYMSAPAFRPKLTIQCYDCQMDMPYRIVLPVIISNFTVMQ